VFDVDIPAFSELDPTLWDTLAQRADESAKAYQAFLGYVRLGSKRSLRKLHEAYCRQTDGKTAAESPPTTQLRTLERWSTQFQWQARIQAYHQERERQEQERWEQRRQEVRDADWEMSAELRTLVRQALAQMPDFLKTTRQYIKGRDGEPDREVITVQPDLQALIKALELVSKLQRQAAEVAPPAQRHEHTGKGGGAIKVQEVSVLDGLTPDMAAAAQAALKAALEAAEGGSSDDH